MGSGHKRTENDLTFWTCTSWNDVKQVHLEVCGCTIGPSSWLQLFEVRDQTARALMMMVFAQKIDCSVFTALNVSTHFYFEPKERARNEPSLLWTERSMHSLPPLSLHFRAAYPRLPKMSLMAAGHMSFDSDSLDRFLALGGAVAMSFVTGNHTRTVASKTLSPVQLIVDV